MQRNGLNFLNALKIKKKYDWIFCQNTEIWSIEIHVWKMYLSKWTSQLGMAVGPWSLEGGLFPKVFVLFIAQQYGKWECWVRKSVNNIIGWR